MEDLMQLVTLFFVNPNDTVDKLAASVFGSNRIVGRSHVVAQWLLVQKRLNKHYWNIDVSSIEQVSMDGIFSRLEEKLKESSEIVDNEEALIHEERLGSDVAHNQHLSTEDDLKGVGDGNTEEPVGSFM